MLVMTCSSNSHSATPSACSYNSTTRDSTLIFKRPGFTMSMYVRVKRNHQTIFLHVEPNETVQSVKAQVGEILGQSVENIRLYGSDRTRDMPDGSSLAEFQDIKNDSIIYAVFRNEGTKEGPTAKAKNQGTRAIGSGNIFSNRLGMVKGMRRGVGAHRREPFGNEWGNEGVAGCNGSRFLRADHVYITF
ncbi:ubiquitin family protein [Nannochloropsis gaditana]|uniref:Ubiquitin family protein n=1 Tax=Nannochloropsis gaditana TaxID=72520 RepID=W7TQB7_9STRA|nr:ubiquitin family protein [Nannochloropsis gaditana]